MGGAAILGVGVGIQAYSQYTGMKASEKSAKYDAQMARQNAKIKKERIKDVEATGKRTERQIERETVQFIGDQVTAYTSGNIDISSGVVSEAIEGSARVGAADIVELQHRIKQDVWGLEVGAMNDETSAAFSKSRAKKLSKLAPIATAGTLLSGYSEATYRKSDTLARKQE